MFKRPAPPARPSPPTVHDLLSGAEFAGSSLTADIQEHLDFLARHRMTSTDAYARHLIFEPLDGLITVDLLNSVRTRLLELRECRTWPPSEPSPSDPDLERLQVWLALLGDSRCAAICAKDAGDYVERGGTWHRAWTAYAAMLKFDEAETHPESAARYRGSRVDDSYASQLRRQLLTFAESVRLD